MAKTIVKTTIVINNNSNNDNAMYDMRADQTDLNLLCVYFFLIRKVVNIPEKILLKLETITFLTYRWCWLPQHNKKKVRERKTFGGKKKK